MIQFLLVNLFLLAVVLIGAGLLWALGASMYGLSLPPNDHPVLLLIGCVLCLIATYHLCKWLHGLLEKRLRKR